MNIDLFVGSQRKHGVLEYLNKRELTHSYSKTGLHPLVRHDEGMIGLRPVETWEGKPPGAAWRMRAGYGNNWSLYDTPLFKYAFIWPIVSTIIPLIRYSSYKWFEILRISEYLRENRIYLREFK